ncbi:MAG TPA: DoxX family protein [Puia sp.]|jgi:uncharacterized membrane protein YphA (DoxX/SURF4 family)|nr:DoxX family protein [Puia sp.]
MQKLSSYSFPGIVVIRLMVGLVFLSEGIQKFLFPDMDGTGRFLKLGIPHAPFFGPFVGATEIVCGSLLIFGWMTRLACIPLVGVISMAIYYTKLPELRDKGFWTAAHDGRADFCMVMGLVFLLIVGAGRYSIDNRLR